MFKEVPLANASAVLMAGLYLVCRILASVAPDFLRTLAQVWFHTFDLSTIPAASLDFNKSLFGFVTAVVLSWITAFAFARLYNNFITK